MQLTVMSYNIKVGEWTNRGLDAVAEVIEAAAPDVVALQEVDRGMNRTGGVDQAAWLGQRLGYHALFVPATDGATFGDAQGEYGVGMLSRWPIVEHDRRLLYHRPLPEDQRPPGYSIEQRVILGCSVSIEETLIDIFCTHWDLTQDQRIPQAREVAAFCTTWHPGRPVVLMGDLNALPDAEEIATLRAVLTDVFEERGVRGDERLTCPSGPPGSRTENGWAGAIDYVFVSPHWRSTAIDILREATPASDHAPVVARLELPREQA